MNKKHLTILLVSFVITAGLGGCRLIKKTVNEDLRQRQMQSMQKLSNIHHPSSKGVGELIPSK